jgi:hypothetical protein
MDTTLLQETFKYFAKFPAFAGVNKNFNTSASQFSEYSPFKTEIQNLTEKELIPGIEDYVFGVNEDMVKRRIEDITGIYLFIDYGAINSDQETDANVEQDEFRTAVTVAWPIKQGELDAVETMFMHQLTLDYIVQIKEKMRQDSRSHHLVKRVSWPIEINPWFARELMNSTGWSMLFSQKGVELV